ncbi:MAG: XRE family transcriptional regulator [Comamonadaceae bacterium]|nr:MAG: XRE family transcriptional regulator [Comamonadaceae bacterium]
MPDPEKEWRILKPRPVASPFPTLVPLKPPSSASVCRAPAAGRPDTPVSRVGAQVRSLRMASGLSGGQLAENAGVSRSLLSRIERGLVSPSVRTLERIAQSLDVAVSRFFTQHPVQADFCLVRAGRGLRVNSADIDAGHSVELLGHLVSGSLCVEPYRIQIAAQAEVGMHVQHPGLRFLYMQSGHARYRYGSRMVEVGPGDALLFDGTAVHGIDSAGDSDVSYLSIVFSLRD